MHDWVVVGHVTRDLIIGGATADSEERLGGAVSYVSQTAACFGVDVDVVTAAPISVGLLEPLVDAPRIRMHVQPSVAISTFELDYSRAVRGVRLLERAAYIAEVPHELADARIAYLAPVIGEVPLTALDWFPKARVTVGLQGWMRRADDDGHIHASDPPSLELLAKAHAVVFSEHDHPNAEAIARALALRIPVVVLTRGAHGATLFDQGVAKAVSAVPAIERDPTGAGDVFAATLTVWLGRDAPAMDAAAQAAYAAAKAVEGVGMGNLR